MKDSLEGDRPTGVDLGKAYGTGTLASGGSSSLRPLAIIVVLALLSAIAVWAFTRDDRPAAKAPPAAARRAAASSTPERTYVGSRMEKVVIADFTPSDRMGDDDYAARVRLLGHDGLEMDRRLPLSCDDAPIEARLHRIILVRSDSWRLRGGGSETMLSEDDAEAALCGDFRGRDVPRTSPNATQAQTAPRSE